MATSSLAGTLLLLCAVALAGSAAAQTTINTNGITITIQKTSAPDVLDTALISGTFCVGYVQYTVTNIGDSTISATGVPGPVLVTAPPTSNAVLGTPSDYLYSTSAVEGTPFSDGVNITNFGNATGPSFMTSFAIRVKCQNYVTLTGAVPCGCQPGSLPMTFVASGNNTSSGLNTVVCPMSYALYSRDQCVQIRYWKLDNMVTNTTTNVCSASVSYLIYNGGVNTMDRFNGALNVVLNRGVTVFDLPRPSNLFDSTNLAIGATNFTILWAGFLMPPGASSFFSLPVQCIGLCPCAGFTTTSFSFASNIRLSPPPPPAPPPPSPPPPSPIQSPPPPLPPGALCACAPAALGSVVCSANTVRVVVSLFAYNPMIETSVFYSICLPTPSYDEFGAEIVFSMCLAHRCLPSVFAGQRYRVTVSNLTRNLGRMPAGPAAVQALTTIRTLPVAMNVMLRPANASLPAIGPLLANRNNTNVTVPEGGLAAVDVTMVVDSFNDENTVAVAVKSWANLDPAPSLPSALPLITPSTPVLAASFTMLRYVSNATGLAGLLRNPSPLISLRTSGYTLMLSLAFSDYSLLPDCSDDSRQQLAATLADLLGVSVNNTICSYASSFNSKRRKLLQAPRVDNACLASTPIFLEVYINSAVDIITSQSAFQVAIMNNFTMSKVCITRVRVYTGVVVNQIALGTRRQLIAGVSDACQAVASNLNVPVQQMANLNCYVTTAAEAGLVPPSPPPLLAASPISPASIEGTPLPSGAGLPASSSSDSNSNSAMLGGVIGGVVGGVLLIGLLAALFIMYRRRRQDDRDNKPFTKIIDAPPNTTLNVLSEVPPSAGAPVLAAGQRGPADGTPVIPYSGSPSHTPIKKQPRPSRLGPTPEPAADASPSRALQTPQCHASYVYEPPVAPIMPPPPLEASTSPRLTHGEDVPTTHLEDAARGSGGHVSGGVLSMTRSGRLMSGQLPIADADPSDGLPERHSAVRSSAPVITSGATLAAAPPTSRELRSSTSGVLRSSQSGRFVGITEPEPDPSAAASVMTAGGSGAGGAATGMESRRMYRQFSVSQVRQGSQESSTDGQSWVGERAMGRSASMRPSSARGSALASFEPEPALPTVAEAGSPFASPMKPVSPFAAHAGDPNGNVEGHNGSGHNRVSPSNTATVAPHPGGKVVPLAVGTASSGPLPPRTLPPIDMDVASRLPDTQLSGGTSLPSPALPLPPTQNRDSP